MSSHWLVKSNSIETRIAAFQEIANNAPKSIAAQDAQTARLEANEIDKQTREAMATTTEIVETLESIGGAFANGNEQVFLKRAQTRAEQIATKDGFELKNLSSDEAAKYQSVAMDEIKPDFPTVRYARSFKYFGYALAAVSLAVGLWAAFDDEQHIAAQTMREITGAGIAFGAGLAADALSDTAVAAGVATMFSSELAVSAAVGAVTLGIGLIVGTIVSLTIDAIFCALFLSRPIPSNLRVAITVPLSASTRVPIVAKIV